MNKSINSILIVFVLIIFILALFQLYQKVGSVDASCKNICEDKDLMYKTNNWNTCQCFGEDGDLKYYPDKGESK